MPKIFDNVRFSRPRMSAFDLSHEKKLSLKMGNLYPMFHEEIIPGDQFSVKSEVLMRMAPMIAPIMHKVDVYVHYFFVPNRIIWNQWEEFITGGKLGDQVISLPTVNLVGDNAAKGKLGDYFGLPVGLTQTTPINSLPFRAYVEIWNEYYRDQNLTDPIDYTSGSWGTSTGPWADILPRAWEKDYFTSALPFTQRGPEVSAPLQDNNQNTVIRDTSGNLHDTAESFSVDPVNGSIIRGDVSGDELNVDNSTALELQIRELRRVTRLQEFFEKAARAGSRYKEQLLAYFGVNSSDARLQRPEYLGGGRQPLVVSEVLNTSATTNEPQGNMAGHGITVGGSNTFKRVFEEHGHVVGLMSVIPRTSYQQGIHRYFTRDDRFDYYFPEFANIGEQAVHNYEIFQPTGSALDEGVFGYQDRYSEYKFKSGSVHGDFRDTLDFWHMGRKFASAPVLNETFVQSDPTDRIYAVQDGSDYLYCHVYNSVKARRPIPYFSDPRL